MNNHRVDRPASRSRAAALAAMLRHPVSRRVLVGVMLSVAPLAGCSRQFDSYQMAGSWHPAGVNEMNIATQAANPRDLLRGRGDDQSNLRTGATAVTNLWSGKPNKPAAAGGSGGGAAAQGSPGLGAAP